MKTMLSLLLTSAAMHATAQTKDWSEFISAKRNSYSSEQSDKAKGIEVSFDYPASWIGVDAKRPNTLYQVTSERGKGLEICNLGMRHLDIPSGQPVSTSEIDEAFSPSGLKVLVPSGGKFLAGKRTTIDGQPAAQVQFLQEIDTAGIQLRQMGVMYPIYFRNSLVVLTCMVGDSARNSVERLDQRYRSWMPLFQQMANSVVIHSKWKKNQ